MQNLTSGEAGGTIHAILSAGPESDTQTALDVYVQACCELNAGLSMHNAQNADDAGLNMQDIKHEIIRAEIKHLKSIFSTFLAQWIDDDTFRKNNDVIVPLATVFVDDPEFMGDYNKVCYLIRQNLPLAVGTGADILRPPEPFKSEYFDD